jgi:hypothetical protein
MRDRTSRVGDRVLRRLARRFGKAPICEDLADAAIRIVHRRGGTRRERLRVVAGSPVIT